MRPPAVVTLASRPPGAPPTNASPSVVSGSTVNVPVAAGTYTEGGIFSASTSGTFVGSAAFAGGNVVVSGTGASIDVTPSLAA